MNILMEARFDLFERRGGDTVQIENTALELRKLGHKVDISTDLSHDLLAYDIVHLFQLDWIPETYFYAKKVKEVGKPLILSPIHHSEKEVAQFDETYVFGYRRLARYLFKTQEARDSLKNIYRAISDPRKIKPTVLSIFLGLRNVQRRTLEFADMIIVQTNLEEKDLQETYKISVDWKKITNGVSPVFLTDKNYTNLFDFENYIVCAGRIEPRKNQLSIIKAVRNLRIENGNDLKLVFVGEKSKRHFEYILRFDKELKANEWITYIKRIPYENMPSIYHFAKVCVSASWFETTGLTSLEALLSGTNVVATGRRARESLSEYVSYCKPGSIESIQEAIKKELKAKRPEISYDFFAKYTWSNAALEISEIYKNVLKKYES